MPKSTVFNRKKIWFPSPTAAMATEPSRPTITVSSMFTNDCIRFCRMMGRAMVSRVREKWGGSRRSLVTANSLWLATFYHVGMGNESAGKSLRRAGAGGGACHRNPQDAEKHKGQGWGSYPLDSDKWWEELPSMRRRAERYGLVVMCLLRI